MAKRNWKKEYAARKEYLKAYRRKNKDKDAHLAHLLGPILGLFFSMAKTNRVRF